MKLLLVALCASLAASEVFFSDNFDSGFDSWVQSEHKSDLGKFESAASKYAADASDKGIKTSEDAHFYALSSKFPKSFSNEGKTLIVQFLVKHEQNIDCGGGYVKIFPSTVDQKDLHGETPYNIMFGPDICGPGTRKVHVIFGYNGKNLLTKKSISCKADEESHLYTLVVSPDNKYSVKIDGDEVETGDLYEDFDFLEPKTINDPSQSKPSDWVDEKEIDDPEDKKPEDWDKPETIPDPEATKPEDWDDDMDGEWEAPTVPNPEYKGEWKPKKIPNPAYKGEWEHPQIPNPDFKDDATVYKYSDFGAIGFDLWQVKAGTIFDDILITDDQAEADKAVTAFKTKAAGEKANKDKADEEEKKKQEAEAAAKKAAEEAADEDVDADEDEAKPKDEL